MIIDKPNYTQIPNIILDNMSEFSDAEFKVLLSIARKTFGWQKEKDRISISQLIEITGMSNRGILNGIKRLEDSGIIIKEKTFKGNIYEIVVNEVHSEEDSLVNEVHKQSERGSQEVVNEVHTQKKTNKLIKKTTCEPVIKEQSIHQRLVDYFDRVYQTIHGGDRIAWVGQELRAIKNIINITKNTENQEVAIARKIKLFQDCF